MILRLAVSDGRMAILPPTIVFHTSFHVPDQPDAAVEHGVSNTLTPLDFHTSNAVESSFATAALSSPFNCRSNLNQVTLQFKPISACLQ